MREPLMYYNFSLKIKSNIPRMLMTYLLYIVHTLQSADSTHLRSHMENRLNITSIYNEPKFQCVHLKRVTLVRCSEDCGQKDITELVKPKAV